VFLSESAWNRKVKHANQVGAINFTSSKGINKDCSKHRYVVD